MNKYTKTVVAACLMTMSSWALADLTIGAGVGVGNSPYKNYDTVWSPVPIVHYQKNRFFIDSLKAGVNLLDSETTQIDVHVAYLPLQFKRSRTDNPALKKLDERKSTMLAGVGFSHRFNQQRTEIAASLNADVLDRSNSFLIDAGISHHFSPSDKLTISPTAGILWANKDHNNYYYRVSAKESARSGLNRYSADASIHPYVGLSMHYKLTEHVSFVAVARVDFLPNKVKNSPMVGRSTVGGIAAGLTYHLK